MFFAACERGELNGLIELLAADATFWGDSGGKVAAVTSPVVGRDHVVRFLGVIFGNVRQAGMRLLRAEVNGQAGAKFVDQHGRVVGVWALDIAEGRIQCVRSVVNPEKLRHLGPVSDFLAFPTRPAGSRSRSH